MHAIKAGPIGGSQRNVRTINRMRSIAHSGCDDCDLESNTVFMNSKYCSDNEWWIFVSLIAALINYANIGFGPFAE